MEVAAEADVVQLAIPRHSRSFPHAEVDAIAAGTVFGTPVATKTKL
jgi:hypothetical protein